MRLMAGKGRRPTLHTRVLRHQSFAVAEAAEAVDGGEVGEGAGFEDVGAEAAAADFSLRVFELDVDLAHGFLALGDGADAVVGEVDPDGGEALDCGVDGG